MSVETPKMLSAHDAPPIYTAAERKELQRAFKDRGVAMGWQPVVAGLAAKRLIDDLEREARNRLAALRDPK